MFQSKARSPALLPVACLLLGIALSPLSPEFASVGGWIGCGLVGIAVVIRASRPLLALALVCSAAVVLGLWLDNRQRESHELAVSTLFPSGSRVRELHLVGELFRPPERDAGGDTLLWLRGAPEHSWAGSSPSYTIRLRVPKDRTGRIRRGTEFRVGSLLRVWCRLRRAFDGPASNGLRPYHGLGYVKSARLIEVLGHSGPPQMIAGLRQAAGRRLDRVLPARAAGRPLMHAMLLGTRDGIPELQRRNLRDAGMLHLVAISGLHVAIVVSLVWAVACRTKLTPWVRTAALIVLLTVYAPAVGARPSVVRAAVGAGAVLVGRCCGREGVSLNSLAVIAALLAAVDPSALRHPAFQLTFLAALGLLLLPRRLSAVLPLPSRIAGPISVSLAAYLATAPAVAWHFGHLAPVGLLSNLAAVPVCGIALTSGYAAIVLEPLFGAGQLMGSVASQTAAALLDLASFAAAWDPGSFAVARPSAILLVAYYVVLLLYGAGRPAGAGAMLVALALSVHLGPLPEASGEVEVTVLDVGQGLSVAVRAPSGGWLLVDAGGRRSPGFDPGERVVMPYLLARGGRRIEALILTHGHVDHAGGAFALLRELEVGQLWVGAGYHRSRRLLALVEVARARRTGVVLAEAGGRAQLAGLPLRVVAPSRTAAAYAENDASVVAILGRAPRRLLVPGDLEREGETALVRSTDDLRAELLVVSHHGSRHGSTQPFLARVQPRWALVSAGRGNAFGHPHGEVVQRFRSKGVPLLRTDVLGPIRMRGSPTGWMHRERLTPRGSEPK